jgi:hypothetical protein
MDPESHKGSINVPNSEAFLRSQTSKALNQFTPVNRADSMLKPRKSNSAFGSIGISKVRIEENNEFNLKDVSLPVIQEETHDEQYKPHHIVTNINYTRLYKLATIIGLSVLGYCVYKDEDMSHYIVDKSTKGVKLIKSGGQAIMKFLDNNELLKYIIIGGAVVIILLILTRKLQQYKKDSYKLIAENFAFRIENSLTTGLAEYVDAGTEMEALYQSYNISLKEFKTQVLPKVRALFENHPTIGESNVYSDGVVRTIWTLK